MYTSNDSLQISFNPMSYGFKFTDDWYEFDYDAAHKAARKARSKRAKELRSKGWSVKLYTFSNQRITRGGIGSGKPEITQIVSVYMLDASR